MKHKIVNLLSIVCLCAMLASTALARGTGFTDVSVYDSYALAVEYVSDEGIMDGYEGAEFRPNNGITRAELATVICRMLGQDENLSTNGSIFTDVPASHWANKYIAKASSLGIVTGFPGKTFRPSDPVSYDQAITMLVRAFGRQKEAENAGGYPSGYRSVAQKKGWLSGVGSGTKDSIRRYEVATIIYNRESQSGETPPRKPKSTIDPYLRDSLCWDRGWVGESERKEDGSMGPKCIIRFYSDNTIKMWFPWSLGGSTYFPLETATFSVNGDTVTVGGCNYKAVIDYGIVWHLSLEPLGADTNKIGGLYKTAEAGTYDFLTG